MTMTDKKRGSTKERYSTNDELKFLSEFRQLMKDSGRFRDDDPSDADVKRHLEEYLDTMKKRINWGNIDPQKARKYCLKLIT